MKIQVHNPTNLPLIDYRTLNPLQGNLKDLHEKDYLKLRKSISERGFLFPFFIWFNPEDEKPYLIDGHGRHRVLRTENAKPYKLPYVQIPGENREEAKKNLLVATSQYQKMTQEGLDEFSYDLPDEFLQDFTSFAGLFDFDQEEEDQEGDLERYTKKIEAPVYEPKNEEPSVSELFVEDKTLSLIEEVEKADIPPEIKAFLKKAAARHTVFNFQKIADYYSHAEPVVQRLMERSALVIIDFGKAIEEGFVELTEDIRNAYLKDHGHE